MQCSVFRMLVIFCLLLPALIRSSKNECGASPDIETEAHMELKTINDVINFEKYPIHEPHSNIALQTTQTLHDQFHNDGICILPDFVLSTMAKTMATQILTQENIMFWSKAIHNIYQEDDDDPIYDDLHPRNRKIHTECLCLPYDDIPINVSIRSMFEYDLMTRFISAIVNGNIHDPPPLYRFADPLGALTVNILLNNHIVDWHFDQAQFVVILLLQNSDIGGEYEVVPESKYLENGDIDYELHANVLNGTQENVIKHRFEAGTLILHRGTHSLHRVSRVYGDTERVSVLFAYSDKHDQVLSESVRKVYYGRTQARQ